MPNLTPDVLEVLTGPARAHLEQLDATAERLKTAVAEEDKRRILKEAKEAAYRLVNAADEIAAYLNISTV